MSDQLNEVTKNQEIVKNLLTQETRVAVNMQKVKEGYDKESYSMRATMDDMALIDQLLESETELTEMDRQGLMTVRNRNASHKFVNQQKLFGDSKEMKAVKEKVTSLEQNLHNEIQNASQMDAIENMFIEAMGACDYYIQNKNPWFSKGIERKRFVEKQRAQLQEEYSKFQLGRKAYDKTNAKSYKDLITLGGERYVNIVNTMDDYKAFFERNLNDGESVYQDVCQKTNIDAKKAPVLSEALKTQLEDAIYRDNDVFLAVDQAKKLFKSEDAPHVPDGNMFMQYNYVEVIEKAYKKMHENEKRYENHKPLFDAIFNRLVQCSKTGDGISFIVGRIFSFKMNADLTIEEDNQLQELTEYYGDVMHANNVLGGALIEIIKKIASLEPLSDEDMALLDEGLTEQVNAYQDNFSTVIKAGTADAITDPDTVTEGPVTEEKQKSSGRDTVGPDSVEKQKSKDRFENFTRNIELREFREDLKKARKAMNRQFKVLASGEEAKNASKEDDYSTGLKLEQLTKDDLDGVEQQRNKRSREEHKKELHLKDVKQRRFELGDKRYDQAYKDYEQKLRWYEGEMRLQKEYIAKFEKNHIEPEAKRKVMARYNSVKKKYDSYKDKNDFLGHLDRELDHKYVTAFLNEVEKYMKEKGLDRKALNDAVDGKVTQKEFTKKLRELLEFYSPKMLAKLVKKERAQAEEAIDHEQRRAISRGEDLRMTPDYRAFRMNRLFHEQLVFYSGVEDFIAGKKKQASMESVTESFFVRLYDFAFHNFSMPDDVAINLRERMHAVKENFRSQHQWTNVSENIKLVQQFHNEMKIYIEKENEMVDNLMLYYMRLDDKALYEERLQYYLFGRLLVHRRDSNLPIMDPVPYEIPGLKHIEKPIEPAYSDYLPTMEETEEIMKKEEAIKAHQTHKPGDF